MAEEQTAEKREDGWNLTSYLQRGIYYYYHKHCDDKGHPLLNLKTETPTLSKFLDGKKATVEK